MADRRGRHDYSIGHYWNAVDDAADEIEKLTRELEAARRVVEAARKVYDDCGENQSALERAIAAYDAITKENT